MFLNQKRLNSSPSAHGTMTVLDVMFDACRVGARQLCQRLDTMPRFYGKRSAGQLGVVGVIPISSVWVITLVSWSRRLQALSRFGLA
jgi:hypothetical protein